MSDAPERIMTSNCFGERTEYIRADIAVMKPRDNDGSHWATCYEAHGHHDCALKRIAELTDMHDSDTEELGLIRMLCDGLPVDDDDECETLMQVKRRIAELESRLVELADEHATQLIGAIEQHPDVLSEFREAHEMRRRIAELEARLDTVRNLYPHLENITHAEKERTDA